MQDIKLIPATVNDIQTIAALARIIWNQHYPTIISQQQIDYMLQAMYSDAALTEQMEKKAHRFYLVKAGVETIGFISVHDEGAGRWFLNKFYINQEIAARGLGGRAFEFLLHILHPLEMALTVNRQNFKAINFYFKQGFKIEKVADFDIGNGYVMNDFVMVWKNTKKATA
jgi:GNAT superfamily N-acetyltransferase